MIKDSLTVIDRGTFVLVNGQYHKEFLEKEATKAVKKIPKEELKKGFMYSTLGNDWVVYLGNVDKTMLFTTVYGKEHTLYSTLITKKSHSYRIEKELSKDYVSAFNEVHSTNTKRRDEYIEKQKIYPSMRDYYQESIDFFNKQLALLNSVER